MYLVTLPSADIRNLQAVNVLPGVMTWQVREQQKPGFLSCCHFAE